MNPGDGQWLENYWLTIPGWIHCQAIYDLAVQTYGNGARFCELGVWQGQSAIYLGEQIRKSGKQQKVVAIDHFFGNTAEISGRKFVEPPGSHLLPMFIANLDRAGLRDIITPIVSDSARAAELFADQSFEMVYVDAGHTYQEVRSDLEAWWPKVKRGGIMAGDDFHNLQPGWGVDKAVAEIFGEEVGIDWCAWQFFLLKGADDQPDFETFRSRPAEAPT